MQIILNSSSETAGAGQGAAASASHFLLHRSGLLASRQYLSPSTGKHSRDGAMHWLRAQSVACSSLCDTSCAWRRTGASGCTAAPATTKAARTHGMSAMVSELLLSESEV